VAGCVVVVGSSGCAAMINAMTVSAGTCWPSAGSLSITVPAGESLVT
jgi:hypothetical protein